MEKHKNGKILFLLFTGVLMGALDISIVGPAIPSIEQSINVDHKSLAWIFSIYVLFNLIGVSLLSRLSDFYGRRAVYIFSVGIFAMGSAIVAFSGNMSFLLLGRAVQGFGSSGIFPVASAVIGDIFPPEKRGKALGMIGAVFGMAFLIGPLIAGIMLKFFSWNSLFLINLPIALVVIIFSARLLPSHRRDNIYFDWPGMLLLSIMLASFVYGINSINVSEGLSGFLATDVWPFFVLAIISFVLFVSFEKKSLSPVLKISLFGIRQIRIIGIVAIGAGLIQSVTIFVPEIAVELFNVSTSNAAFMLIPFVLAVAIGAPVSGRILDKVGSRIVVLTGLFASASGLILLYFLAANLSWFYIGGILIGIGTSMLQGSSMRYIMLNEVQSADRAMGQGLITLFVSVGQMTGATFIGIMVSASIIKLQGYSSSFIFISVIALLVFLLAFFLKSHAAELKNAAGTDI